MKKSLFIILAVLAGSSANLSAQTVNGGVEASDVKVNRVESSMYLEMTLDIRKEAVTKCQSVAITPIITNGHEEERFPYVLVNGRNKRQMFERKTRFENMRLVQNPPMDVVNIDRKNRSEKIAYVARIDYEPWMDDAAMAVEFIVSSCAGQLQRYVSDIARVEVVKEIPAPPVVIPAPEPETVVVEKVVEKPIHYISGAANLDFQTGSSVILPSFKRNPQELQKIDDALRELRNNPNAEITGLAITGYASPDGRYVTNEKLADERALAFSRYVQNRYDIRVEYSDVDAVAEDWNTLRQMVSDSEMDYKSQVLAIIDGGATTPDGKEALLRRLAGGRIWNILLSTMFPQLRRVEYRIDYKLVE